MSLYTGCHCGFCRKPFLENDDIVVCPECGTPYHRVCWQEAGGCVHEAEHAAGYVYVHEAPPQPVPEEQPEDGRPAGDMPPLYTTTAPAPGSTDPFPFEQHVLGPEDEFEGIKSKDWAAYIRLSVPFYLMRFFRMDVTRNKLSLSFSAFLFGPIYFFYRKMYSWAFAFAAFTLVSTLPSVVLFWYDTGSALTQGINPQTWQAIATVMSGATWGVKILAGMFAVYLYKQQAMRKIREVYRQCPDEATRTSRLSVIGGVDLAGPAICMVVTTLLISGLMIAFAGPQLSETLQAYSRQFYAL